MSSNDNGKIEKCPNASEEWEERSEVATVPKRPGDE
jgi:hypothetical protein